MEEDLPELIELNADEEVMVHFPYTLSKHQTNSDLATAQMTFPYVDAYSFWSRLAAHSNLSAHAKTKAADVCSALDALVLDSYYGTRFLPTTKDFKWGKSSVYQILPLGKEIYGPTGRSFWSHTSWFSGAPRSDKAYRRYSWCLDGAAGKQGEVGNLYEYLDALYKID